MSNFSGKLKKENYILKGRMTVYETGTWDAIAEDVEDGLNLSDDFIYDLCDTYLKTVILGTLKPDWHKFKHNLNENVKIASISYDSVESI
jgi:hypothetical protein